MAATRVEVEKIPYKILNELSAKLKTVEAQLKNERKAHEEKVQKMSNDYAEVAAKLSNRSEQVLRPFDMNQNFKSVAMNAGYDSKLQDEVTRLKRMVAELVYSNNRYHIALSNCYCLPSVDATSDTSVSLDASISVSTPLPYVVSKLVKLSVPASPASALMSSTSKESSSPVKVDKKDQVLYPGWSRYCRRWMLSTQLLHTRGREKSLQGRRSKAT